MDKDKAIRKLKLLGINIVRENDWAIITRKGNQYGFVDILNNKMVEPKYDDFGLGYYFAKFYNNEGCILYGKNDSSGILTGQLADDLIIYITYEVGCIRQKDKWRLVSRFGDILDINTDVAPIISKQSISTCSTTYNSIWSQIESSYYNVRNSVTNLNINVDNRLNIL